MVDYLVGSGCPLRSVVAGEPWEDSHRAMLVFSYRDPLLINTIGHAVGILLFGVLVALLIQDWRHHGVRQTRLSLTAAVLALLWNLGSLLVLASSGHESSALEAVVTFSFSILSLLPAVLLHSVLRQRQKILVGCGYALSALAVLLHLCELVLAPYRLHQAALLIIAIGFGVLVGGDLVLCFRRQGSSFARDPTLLSLACLLLFSASLVHFGYGHVASAWTAEIAWHHASIPLALFVLLQDYRFLLLDVFFRFLLNFGLAAVYVVSLFMVYHRLSFGSADCSTRLPRFRPARKFPVGANEVAGVAIGITLQVVLVLGFGFPEGASGRDFSYDYSGPKLGCIDVRDGIVGNPFLFVAGIEDSRTIAGSPVIALPVPCRRIMDLKEEFQELSIGKPLGVKDNLDSFGMRAVVSISRVRHVTSRVTNPRGNHARVAAQ